MGVHDNGESDHDKMAYKLKNNLTKRKFTEVFWKFYANEDSRHLENDDACILIPV